MRPEDLLKFGLIPEFIGRLPVISTVEKLDRGALIKILSEPKNALIKQYQKMFRMDDVELTFEQGALEAIADQALARGTGARGLRAILEETLSATMFEMPSRDDVAEVIITEDVVLNGAEATLISSQLADKRGKKSA